MGERSMILPDFQNLYTNKSCISREEQVHLFRKMIEMLNLQVADGVQRYMYMNLHGLLFSIISETNINKTIFMAAETISNELLAVYAEQLRPDNIVITLNINETMDYGTDGLDEMLMNYFDLLQQEATMPFSLIILSYPMLNRNFSRWQERIDNMLAYKGQLILYNCPDIVEVADCFHIVSDYEAGSACTIKVLQTNKAFTYNKIHLELFSDIKELQKEVIRFAESKEFDIQALDKLIRKAWMLEKEAIKKSDIFPDTDLKYNLNEIKNALLDVRYSEEDFEFFTNVLVTSAIFLRILPISCHTEVRSGFSGDDAESVL